MRTANSKTWIFLVMLLASCFLLQPSFAEAPGSIKGDVRLSSAKPKQTAPAIVEYHGPCGTKRSTSVVSLWKERVMDVSLWITRGELVELEKPSLSTITIRRCEFEPKMIPVLPGTTVRVTNEDENAQWIITENGKKKQYMMPHTDPPIELQVKEGQEIHLSSGFYPWMEGWIRPFPNLVAAAVTGWDGLFNFKNIEPGNYTLHAWHPSLGETAAEITVEPGKSLDVELTFDVPKEKEIPVIKSTKLEELFGRDDDEDENPFKK